jgi:hypothetical protein
MAASSASAVVATPRNMRGTSACDAESKRLSRRVQRVVDDVDVSLSSMVSPFLASFFVHALPRIGGRFD